MNQNITLGTNLKIIRIINKLTQDDVAKAIQVARSTYSGYENDISLINIHELTKLADFYNISIDKLIGRQFPKQ